MLNLDAVTIEDINNLETQSWYLYEVDYEDGDAPLRFAACDEDIIWGGNLYPASTVEHSDFQQDTDGKINDVTLSVANADRQIQYYCENYELIGRNVKVLQVFKSQSDAIEYVFKVKGITAKKDVASITLSLGIDFLQKMTPARTVSKVYCRWQFGPDARAAGLDDPCGYVGEDTECKRRWEDCVAKGNQLRFGGFPGILNERFYF